MMQLKKYLNVKIIMISSEYVKNVALDGDDEIHVEVGAVKYIAAVNPGMWNTHMNTFTHVCATVVHQGYAVIQRFYYFLQGRFECKASPCSH